MNNSNQKTIKKLIKEYLKDGKERSIKEMTEHLKKHGIEIEKGSSLLSNSLFSLRKEEPNLKIVARGIYVWKNVDCQFQDDFNEYQKSNNEYDLSDFDTIFPSTKKETKLVISIFENGTFALNTYLLKYFPKYEAEIKLKKDCSQLALIKNGTTKINLGKNGRIKNYDIAQKISTAKIAFPVYYVGKWDTTNEIWVGNLVTQNPNKQKRTC